MQHHGKSKRIKLISHKERINTQIKKKDSSSSDGLGKLDDATYRGELQIFYKL